MNIKDRFIWHYHNILKHHLPFLWSRHLSKQILGKTTDFSQPEDLNEKIQWLMFYTDTSLWTLLADKYAVRKYVTERIGAKYLIPLLGKWDSASDIDFNSLPDKFVMKPNNGSYDCIICRDKLGSNLDEIKTKMDYSLHHKFGYENAEPHYLGIKPCIIAETILESDEPGGLIDYKIWCFNGMPYCIFVVANRDNTHHHADFAYYDLNWNRIPENIAPTFQNNFECPRPINLEEMLEIASKLSDGLTQARIDLYNIGGKIYFGEITMSSNFGMMPYLSNKALMDMGKLVILPHRDFKEKLHTFLRRWIPRI